MLDWLTSDRLSSYAEPSQNLDAPETPAPVFAYRALKSVLFGLNDGDSDEDDKENIPLETRSSKGSTTSLNVFEHKSLTPTRPSPRRIFSPAKSILRTSGTPTPRRQNVSVKFKDIKPTSTDLGAISEEGVVTERFDSHRLKDPVLVSSKSKTSTEKPTALATKRQTPHSESLPETYYNVKEIDAYIAATEREMKKLVRYGQRMREYARLSQKENTALRRELEVVTNKNETLRHRDKLSTSQGKPGQEAKDAGLFDLSPPSKRLPKAAAQSHLEGDPEPTRRSFEEQSENQPRREPVEMMPKEQPTQKLIKNKTEEGPAPLRSDIVGPVKPISSSIAPVADTGRVASRTQLPPDRLAAAKARLRVKSEERRKALGMAERTNGDDHGSSALDWQNL
jgi:hypothetical protein